MNIQELHGLFLNSSGINTDTRKIQKNSVFFALKGDNFNANEFATEALEKGAAYAVIDEEPAEKDPRLILVPDALQTLQELATYHRDYLKIPILALTGSNGKTTTKELINAVLSSSFNTVATAGNLNNHIGVPLTLLSMTDSTEIGIVEMGANHQKEIEFLCELAKPDYGYITNFGKAHLEGFGGVEGVVKGKKELYVHLKAAGKKLFLNLDDPKQREELSYKNTFSFGESLDADIQLSYLSKSSFAGIQVGDMEIQGQLIGAYNARNMAAAYAIGAFFEVPVAKIKTALENYVPANNRSQIINRNSNRIILDAYNANPTSMAAALENLDSMEGDHKVVILGDMFELGPSAEEEHQQIANKLEGLKLEKIYLVGENFFRTQTSEKIYKYRSFQDFSSNFHPEDISGSLMLIKGSRGMALERVLELL
ncbi:UDP-N-acetylmuramoyl-tripeptide--D-alanyl-D-alanine ligase [Salinimicrobium soli]|uniref:UDP-N-acetylmuramoyl-tripeptide--D-alanyl-D- alanine ligase n=1 Tax=Salinimicrobium soli TaxID=1254399 RepID=UPI003AAD3966